MPRLDTVLATLWPLAKPKQNASRYFVTKNQIKNVTELNTALPYKGSSRILIFQRRTK